MATVSITIVDDSIVEPGESVIITLGDPTGATLGSQATHTMTIVDDDGGGGVGSNHVTIDSAAQGRQVTFTTDHANERGIIPSLARSIIDGMHTPKRSTP